MKSGMVEIESVSAPVCESSMNIYLTGIGDEDLTLCVYPPKENLGSHSPFETTRL